jgi:hypothetical protein
MRVVVRALLNSPNRYYRVIVPGERDDQVLMPRLSLRRLVLMSPPELDSLIDAAKAELVSRRRPADDVRLLLQAQVVRAGYAWNELFPGVPAPFDPPADVPPDGLVTKRGDAYPLLLAWPVQEVGFAVPLEKVQRAVGLSENWPEFYSQLEHALRQGWLHFRGRDHAYLTEAGRKATSPTHDNNG